MDDDGGVDVKTVDVPYQARQAKLELDEKIFTGLEWGGIQQDLRTQMQQPI